MKKVKDSYTEHTQIIMPNHTNYAGRLFGGMLMEWIDITAGVVARRHSNSEVTTASVDNLCFEAPAYLGNTLVLSGRIVYVGKTSMVVCVDTCAESLAGERQHVNRAYLTMVAIDGENKPHAVPGLELESDEEHREWAAAAERIAQRKKAAQS